MLVEEGGNHMQRHRGSLEVEVEEGCNHIQRRRGS